MLKKIVKFFHPRTDFSWEEVLALKEKNRKIFKINEGIKKEVLIFKIIQDKCYGMKLKITYLGVITFYLKDQKCFYLQYGLHTTKG